MARSLKLRRSETTHVNFQNVGAYRMVVEAHSPVGMDEYVFLFRRRPPDPKTLEVKDDFRSVCSPGDVAAYPIGDPADDAVYPFFRWHKIDLYFRSLKTAEDAWAQLVAEVDRLRAGLDSLDELVVVEDLPLGEAGDDGSSDSDSLSA